MAKTTNNNVTVIEEKPVKTSYSVLPETTKKIKYIAFMQGTNITALVNESLQATIDQYEKKNGPIPAK